MTDKQLADNLKTVYDQIKQQHTKTGSAKYVKVLGLMRNATAQLSIEVSQSMKAGVSGTGAVAQGTNKSRFGIPPTPPGYGGKAQKKKVVVAADKVVTKSIEPTQKEEIEPEKVEQAEDIPTESIIEALSKMDAAAIAAKYNHEQLKAMCDAIGIEYPKRTTSAKALSKRIVAYFEKNTDAAN